MSFYHVADQNLLPGSMRIPGYLEAKRFISPFVLSCYSGEDIFISTVLASRYSDERLAAIIKQTSDISLKMACEGLFEYVRCTKYFQKLARYNAIYLFATQYDSEQFIAEYQQGKSVYQVNVDANDVEKHDMNLFTSANEILKNVYRKEDHNFDKALDLANKYWSDGESNNPICEYLYSKKIALSSDGVFEPAV